MLQGWWTKQVWYLKLSPLSLTAFLPTQGFEHVSFFWIQVHSFFAFETLQVLFWIYFKVLSFWLRPCSVYKYSFGTLVWFWVRLLHLKLAENAFRLQFIPLEGAIPWELCEKVLTWLSWEQVVSLELTGIQACKMLNWAICAVSLLSCLKIVLYSREKPMKMGSQLSKYFEEPTLQGLLDDFMLKSHIPSSCALVKLNRLTWLKAIQNGNGLNGHYQELLKSQT